MKIAFILSIISSLASSIGVIIAILAFIVSIREKQQMAIFATKGDYEKIINFCKKLYKNNDVSIRLKKNIGYIDELQLLGVLFGKRFVKQFYNFANYNTEKFKTYIIELEKEYHKKLKIANRAF